MTAVEVTAQLETIRRRTRRAIVISIGVHAIAFAWLFVFQKIVPEPPGITEITWIDAAEAAPADLPEGLSRSVQAAPVERVAPPKLKRESDDKFERSTPIADLAPDPQKLEAIEDRLSSRLASLQKTQTATPNEIAALSSPSPVGRPSLAGLKKEDAPKRPETLKRGEVTTKPSPITLQRTDKPRVQRAGISTNPVADTQMERARPSAADTRIRRELAGAQMAGPVADRAILHYVTPEYPDWAKREAVEGSVTIYFVVLPDGHVKENIMVEKTSGFGDFDDNAMAALLDWRFESVKGGKGEQWGTIMFQYRLTD